METSTKFSIRDEVRWTRKELYQHRRGHSRNRRVALSRSCSLQPAVQTQDLPNAIYSKDSHCSCASGTRWQTSPVGKVVIWNARTKAIKSNFICIYNTYDYQWTHVSAIRCAATSNLDCLTSPCTLADVTSYWTWGSRKRQRILKRKEKKKREKSGMSRVLRQYLFTLRW
jgi:hypothetical protein